MDDLSPRQQEIFEFIRGVIDQRGVSPSYREIGTALGIGSTNAVSDHIKALVRKGFIERVGGPGAPRSLRITADATESWEDDGVQGIPILGRIAAGLPLLAHENYEGTLRVDSSMVPRGGQIFALVVTGDSMIEDGIHDGDYLFVREKGTARNGEIAVVMVEGEATVKRFYREGDSIRLQPANSEMEPIVVSERSGDVQVVGIAVGLFRKI
ncbi:MAG: transcriptional repressor LexA [Myxococcales bacterium]|nr:transcriptional repressor LexA [Myxococcales bacterium]MCB9671368.1 transcriptional repressor LexA [Alphaproteobacteria bacterium]